MSGNKQLYEKVCPKCKHVNVMKGHALTVALTCKKCGLYFCVHTNLQDQFADKYESSIPVGSRGTFDGKMYEVMGFTIKRERKYRYLWREYFLFNPHHGIVFLAEYDGNWNFLKPYPKHPWSYGQSIDVKINGEEFQLYSKYKAEVIFCSGEFFHDVIDQTEASLHYEHIDPPYIITFEANQKQAAAYLGEYIKPEKVASAFNLKREKLPPKGDLGYTEPLSVSFKQSNLTGVAAVSIILAIILFIFFNDKSSNQLILREHYDQRDLAGQKMFKTPSFELKNGVKNLSVQVYAPLSNDWFFAEYSLINEETDEEYVFTNEVEYYSGYEGGEHWTEGSNYAEAFLSSIPEGKYYINIYPEFSLINHEFNISVYRDVPFYSNFIIILFVLCLFPGGFYAYRHFHEMRRWKDSDYSPYDYD